MFDMRATNEDLKRLANEPAVKMARMVKELIDMTVIALKKENSDLTKRLIMLEERVKKLEEKQ